MNTIVLWPNSDAGAEKIAQKISLGKINKFKDENSLMSQEWVMDPKMKVRDVIKSYEDIGRIYLGGIPMIADDMMSFIKKDIIVFGLGVLLFIIFTLWMVFKKLIWIIVPISSCFFSVIIMIGLLGLLGWKVTVISSNFIALMLILTMAMNIHMSTRFLQLKEKNPNKKIFEIISKKFGYVRITEDFKFQFILIKSSMNFYEIFYFYLHMSYEYL